jgi:hypothetical protein
VGPTLLKEGMILLSKPSKLLKTIIIKLYIYKFRRSKIASLGKDMLHNPSKIAKKGE